MFELNFKNSNIKQNHSKNKNKHDEGFILAFKFPVVTQFADILTGQRRRIFNWQRTKIFMQFLTAIKYFEINIRATVKRGYTL